MGTTRSIKRPTRIRKYFLQTFGCQMNYSDSERFDTILMSMGLQKAKSDIHADLVIFNTCSIKKHAEDRVLGHIINAKEAGKLVGLTGCMVKKTSTSFDPEKDQIITLNPRIDFVVRIEDISRIHELLQQFDPKIPPVPDGWKTDDYFEIDPSLEVKYRAFVPIMTGCDKFCTYCVVPFTRGRERSRPFQEIMRECRNHAKNGVKEIILVGQNVNSYFLDDKVKKMLQRETDFAYLLDAVAKIPGIKRIRFTSPHPRHMGEDVLRVIAANENISRNIHLPVQSGSSAVLLRMGREHDIKKFKEITKKARALIPGVTISTDIIVGFPGETEEEFQKTVRLFEEEQFLMAYISKFSPRKGTFAGDKMEDDVSESEKKRRYHVLDKKLQQSSRTENEKAVESVEMMLVETMTRQNYAKGKTHAGRTAMAKVGKRGRAFIGEIIPILVTKADTWAVYGEIQEGEKKKEKTQKKEFS